MSCEPLLLPLPRLLLPPAVAVVTLAAAVPVGAAARPGPAPVAGSIRAPSRGRTPRTVYRNRRSAAILTRYRGTIKRPFDPGTPIPHKFNRISTSCRRSAAIPDIRITSSDSNYFLHSIPPPIFLFLSLSPLLPPTSQQIFFFSVWLSTVFFLTIRQRN